MNKEEAKKTVFSIFERTQIFLALSKGDLPVKYNYMTTRGADAWVALENNDVDPNGGYTPLSVRSSELLMKYKDIYLSEFSEGEDIIVFDFGPGEGRPVRDFLIETSKDRKVFYYAVDISEDILKKNKSFISKISENIVYDNILVDFESGKFLEEIAKARVKHGGKAVIGLFLGNTIGNFSSAERVLSNIVEVFGSKDRLITDMQRANESNPQWVAELLVAYNDKTVRDFTYATLMEIGFDTSVLSWQVEFDTLSKTINLVSVFQKDYVFMIDNQTLSFKKGQRIRVGKSAKFNEIQLTEMVEELNLQMNNLATNDDGNYLQMCISPRSSF